MTTFQEDIAEEVSTYNRLVNLSDTGLEILSAHLTEEQISKLVSYAMLKYSLESEGKAVEKTAIMLLNQEMLPLVKTALCLGVALASIEELR